MTMKDVFGILFPFKSPAFNSSTSRLYVQGLVWLRPRSPGYILHLFVRIPLCSCEAN